MKYTRVTADGQVSTNASGAPVRLHTISIAPTTATPTAGLLSIYDSASETGTVIYSEWVFATTEGHTIVLDVDCYTGIYVGFDGTLANVSCTIAWQ